MSQILIFHVVYLVVVIHNYTLESFFVSASGDSFAHMRDQVPEAILQDSVNALAI
jgi:hypothetical protein